MLASNANSQSLFDREFASDFRELIQNLPGQAGARLRANILEAADESASLRMFHGASSEPVTYQVRDLKQRPALRAEGPLSQADSEILYALYTQNVQQVVNRQLEEGQVPSWDMLQQGMRAGMGGADTAIGDHAGGLRRHLDNLKLTNEQKSQIKMLEKRLAQQKADFDRQLKENKDEAAKQRDADKREREKSNGPSSSPKEPGFAGLLKQAQRYDLKIIAIMAVLDLLALPLDAVLIAMKTWRNTAPQAPEDFGTFFMKWLGGMKNHIDRRFGFGDEGRPAPRANNSSDEAHIQNAMAKPTPRPA